MRIVIADLESSERATLVDLCRSHCGQANLMVVKSGIDVDYIEADSNYVKIHVGSERYINRDSLTRLSALLESMGFVRISRAILLNLQRVSFAERKGPGVLAFVLESGVRVVSSTGFRLESGAQLRIARTRGTRRKGRIV